MVQRLVTGWPRNWLVSRRIAVAIILAVTIWLIRSFLVPLIWAVVFATANWPLYRRCAQHAPKSIRAQVLPLAFSMLVTLLVLGPVVLAFGILAKQSLVWLTELSVMDKNGLPAPPWLNGTPLFGARLARSWNDALGAPGGLSALLRRIEDGSPLHSLQSIGHLIAYHAFVATITIVTLVFLFRQGGRLADSLGHRIEQHFGHSGRRLLDVAAAALRATVQSMVLVGLIDGTTMGILYAALHIPSPVAWGAVTGVLAMLPFIGYFAVGAVCLSQLAHGATASALLIGVVGFAMLFLSDKFVRPMLMAKETQLDFLGALMGSVGGLQTFGLLGIFIGPMIIAVAKRIVEDWLTCVRSDSPESTVR